MFPHSQKLLLLYVASPLVWWLLIADSCIHTHSVYYRSYSTRSYSSCIHCIYYTLKKHVDNSEALNSLYLRLIPINAHGCDVIC